MTADEQPQIFQSFFNESHNLSRSQQGPLPLCSLAVVAALIAIVRPTGSGALQDEDRSQLGLPERLPTYHSNALIRSTFIPWLL